MTETVPMFLVRKDEITDVQLVEVQEGPMGGWTLLPGSFELGGDADHIVIESPNGCWELPVALRDGDTLHFELGNGSSAATFQRCTKPRTFAEPSERQASR